MKRDRMKRIAGIVLAATLLFSDLFSFQVGAFSADFVSEREVMSEKDVDGGDIEDGISVSGNDVLEEAPKVETEEKQGNESEEGTGEQGNADEKDDIELSVSGNNVWMDALEASVSEMEETEEGTVTEGDIEWRGHTIPLEDYMVVYFNDDSDDDKLPEHFYLKESLQGNQFMTEIEEGQDWAYALCSALESSLKNENKDSEENVSIDREALISYLYSEDKSEIIDENYGDISKDLVVDPEKGNENATKTGNVHTAMWAVASGYAVKNTEAPKQNYRLNNIYMYHAQERNKIKNAIKKRGEVVISLYSAENYFYEIPENQIPDSDESMPQIRFSYYCPKRPQSTEYEHTVTIVGWDDNYPYSVFKNSASNLKEGQNGAWLVKDAYGYHGENKYWVSYYDAALYGIVKEGDYKGIYENNVNCYSFDFTKDGKDVHTYQYDGGSSCFMHGVYDYARAVNIFPKTGIHEILTAVSFGTYTQGAQYEIQVYLDARPVGEGNDKLILKNALFKEPIKTEKNQYPGYYTIDFDEVDAQYNCEPRLSSWDEEAWYAVEITIVDSGANRKKFWVDGANDYGVKPVCHQDGDARGQSYVWKEGNKTGEGKWLDFGQEISEWGSFSVGKGANIRIKAHTKDQIALEAFSGGRVCREGWIGDSLTFRPSIGGKAIDSDEILEWNSDAPDIADVENGIVYLRAPGYANITVASENYGSDTIEIMVKDVSFTEHLSLCSNSVNMEKRKGKIACIFTPSAYKPHHIEYSVEQEYDQYLWIDETGIVTVREAAGSKEIPVWLKIYDDEENYIIKEVIVSCYQVPVEFRIVNEKQEIQNSFEIKVSDELQMGIRMINPEDADESDIKWKSSNTAVVSVSSQGKIYALKEGTAVITAFSQDDPECQDQVTVKVKTGISQILFSKSYVNLFPNESVVLTVKVLPKNVDNPEIKWTMTDLEGNDLGLENGSVSYDPGTGMLTAGSSESIGITKLKLYAECEGIIGSCFIKVDIPVTDLSLSFSDSSIVTDKTVETSATDQKLNPFRLYCHYEPENLLSEDVVLIYSSDNPDVAKVTKNGEVIPLKAGSAHLAVRTNNGLRAEVQLIIQSYYTEQMLSLDFHDSKIYVGGCSGEEPETTLAAVKTEYGTSTPNEDFYWESSDKNIAVVDDGGQVTAVSKGFVTITATDKFNPSNYVRQDLQVGVGIREIQTKRDYIEIAVGKNVMLDYEVLPLDADEQEMTLQAVDENIVLCSGEEIYALREGITKVYLESEHGIRKEVTVKVNGQETKRLDAKLTRENIEVEYLTTRGTTGSLAQIKAEAVDEYGDTADVSQIFDYYSENESVVQVDKEGYVIGGSAGETYIQVLATDGSGLNTSVKVTVRMEESGIKSVTLNHSKVELKNGEKLALIATVLPENAPGMHEVTWQSLDETVATVDDSGGVWARGYGRTTIVAQSLDGRKSASCEIKVLPMDSQIKLLKIDSQVLENRLANPNSGYQIAVYASDGKDYLAYCEFISSDERVCTVDEKGLVVPAGWTTTGTCTITAKLKNDALNRKVSFKVKLTEEKQAADIRIYANLSSGKKEVGTEAPLYLPAEKEKEIELEGFAVDRGGSFMENSTLKWSVSDKKVAIVKEQKNGKTSLILKGEGSCMLTCSVQNQPQVSVSIPVYVYDRKPVLTEKNLSINLLKRECIFLPIQECTGTEIEELHIAYIMKGKQYWESGFNIILDNDSGRYVLDYNVDALSKGSYVVYAKATIRFDDSEEGRILKEVYQNQGRKTEILELPIKVTEQQPKIKIKQPTLNVFKKNAEKELEITTGEEIESIQLVDGKSTGIAENFSIQEREGSFRLNTSIREKGAFHAVLQVYLKNYINPISVKCTIKTVITKPKLKTESETIFVYKKKDETADVSFRISDSLRNEYISQEDGYEVVGGSLESDEVVVHGLDAYGKKTIELSIKNETLWNDDIPLKVPVTVEDENQIAPETSQEKITLNKRLDGDTASVRIYMKQQNTQISSIEAVYFKDSKDNLVRDNSIVWEHAEGEENVIEFWVKENCKKGKYKVDITVKATLKSPNGSTSIKTCTKSITLVVEDASPTVKVKLKGNIDLYRRLDTYMTGTLTVGHAASKIVDITSERKDFDVVYDQEKEQFTLALKQNHMISNKKQTVVLKIKLSNGTELKKAVNINLKQSKVKWKKQEITVLYKSKGSRNVLIPFDTEVPADADVRITVLNLPKGMSVDAARNQMSVSINDDSIKPGKYKIKTAVRILDADGLTPMDGTVVKREIVIRVE